MQSIIYTILPKVLMNRFDYFSNFPVLIPAEHLWCDFKWAKNSSPNTNDLYIHYMDKSTGTPSLEEKKALTNCANKDINVLKNCISTSVATVLKCMKWRHPYVQVIGVWWWVFAYTFANILYVYVCV